MSTIQFGGVVSGLNTQGIIDALMSVQKQPLTEMQNKEAALTSQKTAYGQLGTALDDLVAKIKAFTVSSAGASRIGTSADTSIFTATAAPMPRFPSTRSLSTAWPPPRARPRRAASRRRD